MARLIILIAIIAIALILWHKIKNAPENERKKLVVWSIGGGIATILGLLAVTGHLNIITAAIAGGVALLPKLLQFARYIPLVSRLFQQKNNQHQQQASQQQGHEGHQQQSTRGKKTMSTAEAMEVLALKPEYTKEDVIQAHRRMMQKVHPDRGGSDYLAAQINAAKDTLLG
jgi:glucan phosphoethanolaminetransferase (alkaline phosphatase superfamily)